MGMLVAMRYPTILALGAADHTYVMCGTGQRAWACWGGKTGGSPLRAGLGSTRQADAIAEKDERARIKCYLVNGVCHQAANRILFPARILVLGARGYGLSAAIYGPYGRTSGPLGFCPSPFDHHSAVSGDLPECLLAPAHVAQSTRSNYPSGGDDPEQRYLDDVLELYAKAEGVRDGEKGLRAQDLEHLMVELFMRKLDFNLGPEIPKPLRSKLRDLRADIERSRIKLDDDFSAGKMEAGGFVAGLDEHVNSFQKRAADVLDSNQYRQLFDLERGEIITLADPDIVKDAFQSL